MSKKLIFLLTIGMFMMSLSSELYAQSTPAPQLEETIVKKETAKVLHAPQSVRNIRSKNPIRPLKISVEKEIKGIEQQLSQLKELPNPSAFISKRIKHLDNLLVVKKKKRATQVIENQ